MKAIWTSPRLARVVAAGRRCATTACRRGTAFWLAWSLACAAGFAEPIEAWTAIVTVPLHDLRGREGAGGRSGRPYGANVAVADWNEDGDDDLLAGTSYGYFCWFERSFLRHGYARAQVVAGAPP
jgi:hypothetical protein